MAEKEKVAGWLDDIAVLSITATAIWLLVQFIAVPDNEERGAAKNIDEHNYHRVPSMAPSEPGNASNGTKDEQKNWQKRHSRALNGFTFLLVIVGALQAGLLYSQQRAFMSLDSLTLETLAENQPIVAQAIFKNSGGSTAFIIASNTTWKFMNTKDPLPKAPVYKTGTGDEPAGPYVHDESIATVWTSIGSQSIATHPNINAIKSGDAIVYVYGYIQYRDLFRVFSHTTKFCMKYDARNSALRGLNFTRCGNRAYESAN